MNETARNRLAQRVGSTELSREEQETGMTFRGDADRFQITTYKPTIVRSILGHSLAEIEWVYATAPPDRKWREENPSQLLDEEARFEIEGVCATLPIGTLTIKGSCRASNRQSSIVTTPEEIEGLGEKMRAATDGGDS